MAPMNYVEKKRLYSFHWKAKNETKLIDCKANFKSNQLCIKDNYGKEMIIITVNKQTNTMDINKNELTLSNIANEQ